MRTAAVVVPFECSPSTLDCLCRACILFIPSESISEVDSNENQGTGRKHSCLSPGGDIYTAKHNAEQGCDELNSSLSPHSFSSRVCSSRSLRTYCTVIAVTGVEILQPHTHTHTHTHTDFLPTCNVLWVATKHFHVQDRSHTCTQKKKKTGWEGVRLQWVLQKEAASSRCHRWRKSTVTPSTASHPSVGEGIKRLARPHFSFAFSSPVLTAVLQMRKKKPNCWLGHSFSSCCTRTEWVHCTSLSRMETSCVVMNSLHSYSVFTSLHLKPKYVFLSDTSALLVSSQSNFTSVHTSLTKHRWL